MSRRTLCLVLVAALAGCNADQASESSDTDAMAAAASADTGEPASEADGKPREMCDLIRQRATVEECEDVKALAEEVRAGAAALNVPNPVLKGIPFEVTLTVDRRPLEVIERLDRADDSPSIESPDLPAPAGANVERGDGTQGENQTTGQASDAELASAAIDGSNLPTDVAGAPAQDALTPAQIVKRMPGEDHEFAARVGRFMRASLVGQGFEISRISPLDGEVEIPADGQGAWQWKVTAVESGEHVLTAQTQALARVGKRDIPLGTGLATENVRVEVRTIDKIWEFLVALPDWFKVISAVLVGAAAVATAWWGLRRALRGASR